MLDLKPRLIRLFSGAGLVIVLFVFFGIQSAFVTNSADSFAYDPGPTPTPGSLKDLCENHGGFWIGDGHYKESCIYVPPYRPYGKSGASSTGPHWQEDAFHSTTLTPEWRKEWLRRLSLSGVSATMYDHRYAAAQRIQRLA